MVIHGWRHYHNFSEATLAKGQREKGEEVRVRLNSTVEDNFLLWRRACPVSRLPLSL